ncbi:CoA-transferase [Paenibacillus xylaniclasticus]|uniref:CoA-transferase n=1 Tax=Paenibacillus xylaniclasticus TaxID=588083 RepID=UPI000FDBB4BB|nr:MULTISPECIES: CoA-transferase [Paenibacillus]GFN31432.1 3-oxoadipate--succinyl-CoA transferase subunit B [Paenibacillus curdlanolyticus]
MGDRLTNAERLICSLAVQIRNGEKAVVGNNSPIPAAAALLAKRAHAPLASAYILGSSIDWPFTDMQQFFNFVQRGAADVFFLSGAQIDAYGNINLHVIGDYAAPTVRLAGGAGAAMFYYRSKRVYLFKADHELKGFPERLDFITSSASPAHRTESSLGRLEAVYTPIAVLRPDAQEGRLELVQTAPGVTPEEVAQRTGFRLNHAPAVETLAEPDSELVQLLRSEVKNDLRAIYPEFAGSELR